ncbi:hypothetical protein GH733_011609 [Mirounga leonina]|nr:hypothetical protein GH733_011609 [Mirounga leonina]
MGDRELVSSELQPSRSLSQCVCGRWCWSPLGEWGCPLSSQEVEGAGVSWAPQGSPHAGSLSSASPSRPLLTSPPLCFPALKRSFEVEEAETPNSTPHRRVQTPALRATVASSTQKFQDLGVKNSEPAARHVDSLSQRSPKAALRRVELSGPKAEPVSRRTEISIDISSKQVENASTAGPSRFGLKRAEALGHKTPEPTPRRTEITIVKPQESTHRRMETPASKIPEVPTAPTADAAPKRVEIQVPKPAEVPASPIPPQTLENSEHALMSQLQNRLEPKPQHPVVEAPPKSQEGE